MMRSISAAVEIRMVAVSAPTPCHAQKGGCASHTRPCRSILPLRDCESLPLAQQVRVVAAHERKQRQAQRRDTVTAAWPACAEPCWRQGARACAQVKRDSFAHYFSQQKEQNEVTWTPTPLEALLDVDQVIDAWRLRGITIHRARPAHAAPACTTRGVSGQGANA